jgi:inhibitor of cysteine peptidase
MTIKLEVGQEFTITLKSNPTIGYRWELAKPLDEDILEQVGREFTRPESDLVGSDGKETWIFRAVRKGGTAVALKYVQPWEKSGPPAETRTFTVVVVH